MEFAKYYNVSDIVDNMMEKKEIDSYPTGEDKFLGVYVCEDSNDFWISRILKGYNEEYERDDNMYLVERNKIDNCMNYMERNFQISTNILDICKREMLLRDIFLSMEL